MSQRSYSDVPNRIVNLFLQEAGAIYDVARGLSPYRRMTGEVLAWFGGSCAYCERAWEVEEHLVPRNRHSGGLHAHGNVVPACRPCNRAKTNRTWEAHLRTVASEEIEYDWRSERILAFIEHWRYAPDTAALLPLLSTLYLSADRLARELVKATIESAATELKGLSGAERGAHVEIAVPE